MIRYHGQSWSGIQFQFDIFFSALYDNPLITEIMPNFLYHLCFVFLVWTFVFPMIPQVQIIRHLLLQFLHKAYLKRNQLFRNYFYCNECIWLALQRLKLKEIARCREISFAYICWFSSSLYPLVAFLKQ